MKDKPTIIDFREFGLNNPTVIQFYPSEDELIRYEIRGASVEQICEKIKMLENLFDCKKVKYITSPCNLREIKQCSLANVMKSVWTLFKENGITIYEGVNDLL
jgi:hypothetical protein